MMSRRLGTFLTATAVLALLAGPAAAQYPPEGPTGGVDDTTVESGGQLTVSGSGWQAGSQVTLTLLSRTYHLGTAQVDGNGSFSTTVTIPRNARPGRHTLRMSGTGADGAPRTVEISVQIRPAAPPENTPPRQHPPALAATGANLGTGALVGVGLLAAGGAAVFAARRRQTRSET